MNTPQPEVNISVRFVPFGQATIEIKSRAETPVEAEKKSFSYTEPKTTNPQTVEISLGGEEGDYSVPQTTSGSLC
jgi:hypothetical protein